MAAFGFGGGVAVAKDALVGKTYAEAAAKISEWGVKPVISTVVGDVLPTDQCIVSAWRKSSYVSGDNFDHQKSVLVSLNCNSRLASGAPGNSLASPEGRAEKGIEVRADKLNSKPERCAADLAKCADFCNKYDGMCSKDVLALLN